MKGALFGAFLRFRKSFFERLLSRIARYVAVAAAFRRLWRLNTRVPFFLSASYLASLDTSPWPPLFVAFGVSIRASLFFDRLLSRIARYVAVAAAFRRLWRLNTRVQPVVVRYSMRFFRDEFIFFLLKSA